MGRENFSSSEIDRIVRDLYNDLDLGEPSSFEAAVDLRKVFAPCLDLPERQFVAVAMDMSCLAGASGDWESAYLIYSKLETCDGFLATEKSKLWQVRCLVELERFSEALALIQSNRWSDGEQIHVNFLAGISYESLSMSDQAQLRFDAVYRKNPNYRDVAQRRLKV